MFVWGITTSVSSLKGSVCSKGSLLAISHTRLQDNGAL